MSAYKRPGDTGSIGAAEIADGGVGQADLASGGIFSANASYPKTTAGAQTLMAASSVARNVLIAVAVTTTFDAGDGAAPVFDIGQTGTAEKFKADLNTGTAGAVNLYAGTLSANTALLVTATAATGTTSAGAIAVTAIAMPA